MRIVTVSSKRQITIPKSFLEVLGIEPHGRAIIEHEKGKLILKPVKKSVTEELAGSLRKYVHPSLLGKSVKEINEESEKLYTEYLAKKYGLKKKVKK